MSILLRADEHEFTHICSSAEQSALVPCETICCAQELQHHSHRQQPKVSDEQTKSHTKPYAGTYIHHRQSSRIANRFHRRDDYDAENSVAEEFDDWRTSRSKLKNRSLH